MSDETFLLAWGAVGWTSAFFLAIILILENLP